MYDLKCLAKNSINITICNYIYHGLKSKKRIGQNDKGK